MAPDVGEFQGGRVLTAEEVAEIFFEERDLSRGRDTEKILRKDVIFTDLAKKGEGTEKEQRSRCSRRNITLDMRVSEKKAAMHEEQTGPMSSFWLGDTSVKGGCGSVAATRSVDTRTLVPPMLFGKKLKRLIVSSFREPMGQILFVRKWFLHWDQENDIPILVLGDAHRTTAVTVQTLVERAVGNINSDPAARWIPDGDKEIVGTKVQNGRIVRDRGIEESEAERETKRRRKFKYREDDKPKDHKWLKPRKNASIILPWLPAPKTEGGYEGCVHPKLVIAEYDDGGIRLCISSANMAKCHMIHMWDTWVIQDFRFLRKACAPSKFALDLVGFLSKMCRGNLEKICIDGYPVADWITPLLRCDCSAAKNVALVQTCPGQSRFYEDEDDEGLGFVKIIREADPSFTEEEVPRNFENAATNAVLHVNDDDPWISLPNAPDKKLLLSPPLAPGRRQRDNAAVSESLVALRGRVKAEVIKIYCTFSQKQQKDLVVGTLRLAFLSDPSEWDDDSSMIALTRLLAEVVVPQGYHGLRMALKDVDWFKQVAKGEEVLFYGYSPSFAEHGAVNVFENLGWAAGSSKAVLQLKYKFPTDQEKGWNPWRLPAVLGYADLFNKQTIAGLNDLIYHPQFPDGEFASRISKNGQTIGAHAKWLARIFMNDQKQTYGWVYVGSHNISGSAFGNGSKFGMNHSNNWELGIVFLQDPDTIDPLDVPFHKRHPFPYIPGAPATNLKAKPKRGSEEEQREHEQRDNLLKLHMQQAEFLKDQLGVRLEGGLKTDEDPDDSDDDDGDLVIEDLDDVLAIVRSASQLTSGPTLGSTSSSGATVRPTGGTTIADAVDLTDDDDVQMTEAIRYQGGIDAELALRRSQEEHQRPPVVRPVVDDDDDLQRAIRLSQQQPPMGDDGDDEQHGGVLLRPHKQKPPGRGGEEDLERVLRISLFHQ